MSCLAAKRRWQWQNALLNGAFSPGLVPVRLSVLSTQWGNRKLLA